MRLARAILVAVVVCGLAAPAAQAADALLIPREPPPNGKVPGFTVDAARAVRIATSTNDVRHELARTRTPPLVARPLLFGDEYWLVDFMRGQTKRVEVQLNGRTGKLVGSWVGQEIDWPPLAHGAHGPRNRRLHKMLVLMGVLFLLPFFDRRRPLRMLHLDLFVLVSFGLSHLFAAKGNIYLSAPLVYPPLLYLLVRLGMVALRPVQAGDGRLTWMPPRALLVALAALLAVRYGYDIVDGQVNDVGYASLYGADSIIHGYPLYDSSVGSGHLDSYGQVAYLAYVPFNLIFGFDLRHDDTQAAIAAAITFDLLTVVGLYVLGRRLRDGLLGLALAWGYAAFPWTLFVLGGNTNDGLVALVLVWTLVAAASPVGRGIGTALAAATKFAPLILGGLFLRGPHERGRRPMVMYAVACAATLALLVFAYLPDGGLREFYDSTIGFQFGRQSDPFSVWGLHTSLKPLHTLVTAAGALLAVGAIFYPRERSVPQLAAAGAVLLIAAQITAIHWYYFYLPWLAPYALVALFSRSYAGSVRNSGSSSASAVSMNSS